MVYLVFNLRERESLPKRGHSWEKNLELHRETKGIHIHPKKNNLFTEVNHNR